MSHEIATVRASDAERELTAELLRGHMVGSVERKGRWRVPRFASIAAIFGNVDFDLRTAELDERGVTIAAFLLFGNADFYVPAGAEVDLGGFTVFGHRREHGEEAGPTQEEPPIRIRVYALFGTSDVWHIPRGAGGSFRELIRSVRGRAQLGAG